MGWGQDSPPFTFTFVTSLALQLWPGLAAPWWELPAFGGPSSRTTEGFTSCTCVTHNPHGAGMWHLCAQQRRNKIKKLEFKFLFRCQDFSGCFFSSKMLFDYSRGVTLYSQLSQIGHLKRRTTIFNGLWKFRFSDFLCVTYSFFELSQWEMHLPQTVSSSLAEGIPLFSHPFPSRQPQVLQIRACLGFWWQRWWGKVAHILWRPHHYIHLWGSDSAIVLAFLSLWEPETAASVLF